MTYKGNVTSLEAAEALAADASAVLLDVRTDAEWNYVGVPAVENVYFVSWIFYPSGEFNGEFMKQVEETGINKDQTLYIICRSGVRSAAAASLLTAAGFKECYNVSDGFEGDKDSFGHRETGEGWKHCGLPWQQG